MISLVISIAHMSEQEEDGNMAEYLSQQFLSYAFVCICLKQRRHKAKEETENKIQEVSYIQRGLWNPK